MHAVLSERLFGAQTAFAHPVTRGATLAVVVLLITSPLVIVSLRAAGAITAEHFGELMRRWLSWCVLVPLMLAPVLLGPAWLMVGVGILSAMCFREFARAVGLLSEQRIVATVYLGIALLTLAALDQWYAFFVALVPLTSLTIASIAIIDDRPHGYVRRVSLAVWGFLLFGSALGHLGYMGNDLDYRPMVIVMLLSVELNDVFAYVCGKLFGRRKLAPNTSPNKTAAGSFGALVLTTALVAVAGFFVFPAGALHQPLHLIVLGLLISILGQLGDLMLSSVKRDVGVKDLGDAIPGHGGLLDRFDSLLLVAPAVFHYVNYFRGLVPAQEVRVLF
jgi:phosphatidate cytidylyltransferase